MTRANNGEPPDRLSILHLLAGSDAGGLSRYVFDLCSALHAQGHRVAVAGERGAWHWLFEKAPFPWIEVPLKGSPLKLFKSHNVLRRYMLANPVHVLHTHYRRATIVARALQYHRKLPILYSVHLSHITIAGPRRWLSDFGDHTHCAATEAKFWLDPGRPRPGEEDHLHPARHRPGEMAASRTSDDGSPRERQLGLKPDDRVAVYVGRLDTPKNERWVIDVADHARHTIPNLKVLMAGDGPHESQVRKRIAADNLGDRVILLGHCNPLHGLPGRRRAAAAVGARRVFPRLRRGDERRRAGAAHANVRHARADRRRRHRPLGADQPRPVHRRGGRFSLRSPRPAANGRRRRASTSARTSPSTSSSPARSSCIARSRADAETRPACAGPLT